LDHWVQNTNQISS